MPWCHQMLHSFFFFLFSNSQLMPFFDIHILSVLISFFEGTLMSSSNIDPSGSNINNGTLPLRSSAYSCPSSTQLTTAMSTIDRPNSNSSNVYQTIDADRLVTSLVNLFSFFNKYVWCSLFEQIQTGAICMLFVFIIIKQSDVYSERYVYVNVCMSDERKNELLEKYIRNNERIKTKVSPASIAMS